MQNFSNEMDAALAQSLTYLCRIWKLVLANGQEFFFTDLNSDIVVGGQLYRYDPGVTVSAVVRSSGGQPDNTEVEVTTSANFMRQNRLRQGALRKAAFDMWIVDHRDPDHYGLISLFSGGVGEMKYDNKGRVSLGLNGDIGGGQSNIGELYSQQCRAQLGDSRCKFDLEAVKEAFEVTGLADGGYSFTAAEMIGKADDYYKFGKVSWETGFNAGLTDEVKANVNATGKITLVLYPRNPIALNDTGFIYPGCDFLVNTCGSKFNNLNNFRGEPYVPPSTIYVFSGLSPVYWSPSFAPIG